MKYDPNKYTQLGIGETVTADCFFTAAGEEPQRCYTTIGDIVSDADLFTYLRPLTVTAMDTIAKVEFASGSKRSDPTGRGRFDLIPYEAMLSLARRYEMGAVHFGENNWLKGQPLSRLLSSMRRHAHQINYDFSEDHIGAVLWNAAAFVTMVARIEAGILPKEIDDIGYMANREASK